MGPYCLQPHLASSRTWYFRAHSADGLEMSHFGLLTLRTPAIVEFHSVRRRKEALSRASGYAAVWLLPVVAFVTAAVGCGCNRHSGAANGLKTVAIVTPSGLNEFNVDLVAGATAESKLLGWNPVLHFSPAGDSDDAELVNLAMTAISKKPDAISVCGMGTSSLENVIKQANGAGIPIFVHNQISPVSGEVVGYIGYDEFDAGRKCGDYAVELLSRASKKHLPVGQVAIIDGLPGEHTNQRAGGFREALKYCANVQIVEEKSGDWTKEKADKLVSDWLVRYPKLTLIFACNDSMAIGASHAIYEANRNQAKRTVLCMGFGGSHDALVKVKFGDLSSTMAVDPHKMGARVIHEMMDYLGGTGTVHVGDVTRLSPTLVTADNIDSFMGGFDSGSRN